MSRLRSQGTDVLLSCALDHQSPGFHDGWNEAVANPFANSSSHTIYNPKKLDLLHCICMFYQSAAMHLISIVAKYSIPFVRDPIEP